MALKEFSDKGAVVLSAITGFAVAMTFVCFFYDFLASLFFFLAFVFGALTVVWFWLAGSRSTFSKFSHISCLVLIALMPLIHNPIEALEFVLSRWS